MARVRRSPEEVRGLAVKAAATLFAERGISATSMAAVASHIGMSKQALMHHFPSKEALRDAVFADLEHTFVSLAPQLLRAVTRRDAAVEAVLSELLSFFADEQPWAKLILRELLNRNGPEFGPLVDAWVGLAIETLRGEQRAGHIRAEVDPEAAIATLGLLVVSTFASIEQSDRGMLRIEDSSEQWRERRIAELVRIVRTALLPDP